MLRPFEDDIEPTPRHTKSELKDRKNIRREILVKLEILRRHIPDLKEWTGNESELLKTRKLYSQIEQNNTKTKKKRVRKEKV